MKRQIFLFILIVFSKLLIAQAYIEGSVTDSAENFILLYTPINGYYNDRIPDTIFTNSYGSEERFFKKVDVKQPMQSILNIGYIYCPVTLIPGDTITLAINLNLCDTVKNKEEKSIIFLGKNSQGSNHFNAYNYPGIGVQADFDKALKKANFWGGLRKIEMFDSVLKRQVSFYDSLLIDKKITKQFHSFICNIIRNYLVASAVEKVRLSKGINFIEVINFSKVIFSYYKLLENDPVLYNSVYSRTIAKERYVYKRMLKEHVTDNFRNVTINSNGKRFFLNGNLAHWQEAPKDLREYLWAQNLLSLKLLFSSSYDQKDVDTYFSVFPNGPYKKYFVPPHYGFLPWAGEDSAKVKLIKLGNEDNLDSVLSNYFQNQSVLVDIWASWCLPCKQEFSYAKEIDAFCSLNNIKRLYISIDKIDGREAFMKDIYAYQLAGSHFVINYSVREDIIQKVFLGKRDNLSVPRYVLINAQGKIVDANLVRPSVGKAFYKTILNKLYPNSNH